MEKIINNDDNKKYYLATNGITNCKVNIYNEWIHDRANIFFKILNKFNLEYYVFAGSAIGLVRDGKNIPWVDDYDIVVFVDEIGKYRKEVMPVLSLNGFICHSPQYAGCQIFSGNFANNNKLKYNSFQCDLFFSYVNKDNYVKNIGNYWGLYNEKNVPVNLVKPAVLTDFHGMKLPFFNNYSEDVKLEYGDVINKSVINVEHATQTIVFNEHFSITYDKFNKIKNDVIDNTKKMIELSNYKPDSNNVLESNSISFIDNLNNFDNKFSDKNYKLNLNDYAKHMDNKLNEYPNYIDDSINILKYISKNNISQIIINCNYRLVSFLPNIKYYFQNIKVDLYIDNIFDFIIPYLNYVSNVYCLNDSCYHFYLNQNIFFVDDMRPNIILKKNNSIIKKKFKRIITFGTFDLFHIGHENILKRAKEYCDYLIVGVSSDALNKTKGKTSVMLENDRINHIKKLNYVNEVFLEESLDKKDEYIKKYNADVLVMGNDWTGKFNWVSSDVLYFERTPNISTTMLKEQMKK